ncbi:TIGR03364 family FAD-dependent oxidoreductase [Rhodopirellula sp. P2]|uniref:TIGR03364 family FAD-dependent oxidoreductase n=1 Tax=Rhodopirellula sp. P2 TaxID=2127060 RepID=UPI002367B431|nr:TIGR03364 family FAD-dependent oxidoreductase [Rhodopirellula sp. P2]WDQ19251.1 TIGR03364 family FAD-dependent oxidoreductase [Rhodopirellula sp. P2]
MNIDRAGNRHSDLLIVGAGVLGSFYAYHALQRGLRVTLVERSSRPNGATARNFGQVVPSGLDLSWQIHGRESLRIYRELQSQTELSVRQNGSIYIASDEEESTLIEELHQINQHSGYRSELFTAAQCQSKYPNLRSDYCRGGLFFPDEVSVNPRRMIHHLHDHLRRQTHFESRFGTLIQQVTPVSADLIHVETSTGETLTANKVIVCCGSEFQTLFPDHFRQSEMKLCKLQMLRLAAQPQSILPGNILTGLSIRRYESFSECPSWKAIKANESTDSFANQWGLHILFKQELDGSIILGDSHEYTPADQPDRLDFDIRSDVNDAILMEAKRIMDLPSWDVESSWYGIYSQTSRSSGIHLETIVPNVHVTTGIGGKGMTSSAGFTRHHLTELYND